MALKSFRARTKKSLLNIKSEGENEDDDLKVSHRSGCFSNKKHQAMSLIKGWDQGHF